jgi:hypothetical protein
VPAPPPQKIAETSPPRAGNDGQQPSAAVNQIAAQAKQAVDTAGDTLGSAIAAYSRVRATVVLAATLLAILVIRRLRRPED